MFNKIKNSKIAKVGILSIALVILVYAVVTLGKTIGAYNIIKANYSEFNYPNTVKVHSGTFMEADDFNIFICKISAPYLCLNALVAHARLTAISIL